MPGSRFDPASGGLPAHSTSMGEFVFRFAGVLCVMVSCALFAVGTVVYLSGNDIALLLMIVAFAGFVTGIGFLAAARAAR